MIMLGMGTHHKIDFYEVNGIWRGASPVGQNAFGNEVADLSNEALKGDIE